MKVRLTHKYSDVINGVDLTQVRTGDTIDLTEKDACTLIAEGWASPVLEGGSSDRYLAHDRREKRRPRAKKR
jgi:hypothetical protein